MKNRQTWLWTTSNHLTNWHQNLCFKTYAVHLTTTTQQIIKIIRPRPYQYNCLNADITFSFLVSESSNINSVNVTKVSIGIITANWAFKDALADELNAKANTLLKIN